MKQSKPFNLLKLVVYPALLLFFTSCSQEQSEKPRTKPTPATKKTVKKVQKKVVVEEKIPEILEPEEVIVVKEPKKPVKIVKTIKKKTSTKKKKVEPKVVVKPRSKKVKYLTSSGMYRYAPEPPYAEVKALEKKFTKESLKTVIPEKMKARQNGYAIIINTKTASKLKELKSFINHKKKRGFNVSVITEKQFGGGVGEPAALKIRGWLAKNYKKRKLLYVLLIGNPDPIKGDIPMLGVQNKKQDDGSSCSTYTHPTDYCYADVTGNWDLNGDGSYADRADFGPGGVDGQCELFVGRISHYGPASKYGKAKDVDVILKATMDFENEKGDLSWRHDSFICGADHVAYDRYCYLRSAFFNPIGANVFRMYEEDFGDISPPEQLHFGVDDVVKRHNTQSFGYTMYQDHAYSRGIGHMMSSGAATRLNPKKRGAIYLGGCDVAHPEDDQNLCHTLLRYGAVAVWGGSRSVTGWSQSHGYDSISYYERLYWGMSTGEMTWRLYSEFAKSGHIAATNFLINLQGDPSLVIMPQLEGPTLSVSPTHSLRTSRLIGFKPETVKYEYKITNNGSKTAKYSIRPNVKWVSVKPSALSISSGQTKSFTASSRNYYRLPAGMHEATLSIKASNTKAIAKRTIYLDHKEPQSLMYEAMSSANNFYREAKDSSGNSIKENLQIVADGKYGAALEARNGILKSELENPGVGSQTIAFWFKLKNSPSGRGIIAQKSRVWKLGLNGSDLYFEFCRGDYKDTKVHSGGSYRFISISAGKVSKNKWYHVTFVIDRNKQNCQGWLNGSLVKSEKLEPLWTLGRHEVGPNTIFSRNCNALIDEFWVLNYPLTNKEIAVIRDGGWATQPIPTTSSTLSKAVTELRWEPAVNCKKFAVYFGTSRSAVSKASPKSREFIGFSSTPSIKLKKKVSPNKKYYWKVDSITRSKKAIKGSVWSFLINPDLKSSAPIFASRIELPDAKVKVMGYSQPLSKFVTDTDKDDRLIYSKVSGPDWLNVLADGLLFTPYGPKPTQTGINEFVVKVTDKFGNSDTKSIKIKVVD